MAFGEAIRAHKFTAFPLFERIPFGDGGGSLCRQHSDNAVFTQISPGVSR